MTADTSVTTAAPGAAREVGRSSSQAREVWVRLLRNRGAVIGLVFLIVLVSAAILAPLVAPDDPLGVHRSAPSVRRARKSGSAPIILAATS